MGKETFYKYRKYDTTSDDYVYSTRFATMTQINGTVIDSKHMTDGWTKKDFGRHKQNRTAG